MTSTTKRNRPFSPSALVAVVVAVTAGLVLRIYCATTDLGALDSDMAVLGLMARDMQDGHFVAFHWGQRYGGSQEAMLAALLGLPFGVTTATLHVTTIALSAVTAGAVGWLGRELIDRRTGVTCGLLMWLWPAVFVWWSVKIGSNYWFALACAVACVALIVRMRRTDTVTRRGLLVAGLLGGLSWWGNPQVAYVLMPALMVTGRWLLAHRSMLWVGAGGFVITSSPWIVASVVGSGPIIGTDPGPSFWRALVLLVTHWLPVVLGLRTPFELHDAGAVLAVAGALALLAAMTVVAVRQRLPLRMAVVGVAFFVVVFCLSPFVGYTDNPRYALWVMPWVTVLAGAAIAAVHRLVLPLALTAVLLSSGLGLTALHNPVATTHYAPDVFAPVDNTALVDLMRESGTQFAFADYWLAYRTTFVAPDLTVAPVYTDRQKRISDAVRASGAPAYVFLTDSNTLPQFLAYCEAQSISCPSASKGSYTVVKPDRVVEPIDAARTVQWLHRMRATSI